MALINSRTEYGRIAKWLHWGVALLVLGSYVTMYTREWFTEEESFWNGQLIHWHFSIGISIGCLMLLRLLWRLLNPRPSLASLSVLHRKGARLSHFTLYLLVLFMPVSGYLSTGADIHYFGLFEITQFKNTALFQAISQAAFVNEDSLKPLKTLHKIVGEWVLWVLVAIHATAGFYHHYGRRDDIMRRMTRGL